MDAFCLGERPGQETIRALVLPFGWKQVQSASHAQALASRHIIAVDAPVGASTGDRLGNRHRICFPVLLRGLGRARPVRPRSPGFPADAHDRAALRNLLAGDVCGRRLCRRDPGDCVRDRRGCHRSMDTRQEFVVRVAVSSGRPVGAVGLHAARRGDLYCRGAVRFSVGRVLAVAGATTVLSSRSRHCVPTGWFDETAVGLRDRGGAVEPAEHDDAAV